ncbi:hypothetical protein BDR05DRAFT_728610 [Suillus weaverae]|nr:hypothetical protein BDR05DRAFT_728610 [Suillus weaverae]
MYDWALTFGQEVELIWRQRWSLMAVLYLTIRYVGIGYAVLKTLPNIPTILLTDTVGRIAYYAHQCIDEAVDVILGVIMIARLHAMYQHSRKVLIILVVTFLAVRIADAVMGIIFVIHSSSEEFVLSGTYQCISNYQRDTIYLDIMTWILSTVWEVLALCLAVWIAVNHFHELRQHSARGVTGGYFMVLMKTHVSYFAIFVGISCFNIGLFSPMLSDLYSLESQIYLGFTQIFKFGQLFVLGPRLILGVREYHAQLAANPDTVSAMTSIAFQERIHVSTSSSV